MGWRRRQPIAGQRSVLYRFGITRKTGYKWPKRFGGEGAPVWVSPMSVLPIPGYNIDPAELESGADPGGGGWRRSTSASSGST